MKIGFTNGCFDFFHPGHEHYLRECRKQCDYLVLALNSDRYCREVKGADRPVWTWVKRMLFVRPEAHAVIPFEGRWDKLVLEIRPHVIFQGAEYRRRDGTDHLIAMRKINWKTEGHGFDTVPIVYIDRLPGYSTSELIARNHEHQQRPCAD